MSAAHKRWYAEHPVSEQQLRARGLRRGGFSREQSGNWKGDRASYEAVHQRHAKILLKKGARCAHCDTAENLHVALRHDAPIEHLLGSLTKRPRFLYFSLDPNDYIRLCGRCHRLYDGHAEKMRAVKAAKRSA